MSDTDHKTPENENDGLRLVKGAESSKRRAANGSLDHSTKLSYYCIGIIVIALLFYFLGSMIADAENLEDVVIDNNA
jgi:hypothetical protein